jgi:flagellar biosynthesis/type III secretory pathway protein FliH
MLVERYLRKRYQAGKAEGLKEGEERGKAEAWEAWQNHRK